MNRWKCILSLILLVSTFCATAHAASVFLVKEGVPFDAAAQAVADSGAIVLTFAEERVVVCDQPLELPGAQWIASDVSPAQLFIVRDWRPMSERSGYETLYSHSSFGLAVVKDPEQLAAMEQVRLRPVTASMVILRKPKPDKAVPDPAVKEVLNMLSAKQYRQYLNSLTKSQPTRYTCADNQPDVRDSISNFFTQIGLAPDLMEFTNKCRSSCRLEKGFNVIAVKKGSVRPQEYYLVGAHYDSISKDPCVKAPGANDNASGTAGILELARVFSKLNTEASLIFVAFGGEEEGLLGSKKYVQTLVGSGLDESIKAFVVLDMISYYKKIKGIIIEGSDKESRQSEVLDTLARCAETYTNLRFVISTDYGYSDHEPFLDNGMAGALFIEADWGKYRHYHTKKDLPAHQNIPFGLEVVKLAAALLAQEAGLLPAQ